MIEPDSRGLTTRTPVVAVGITSRFGPPPVDLAQPVGRFGPPDLFWLCYIFIFSAISIIIRRGFEYNFWYRKSAIQADVWLHAALLKITLDRFVMYSYRSLVVLNIMQIAKILIEIWNFKI